MFLYFHVLGCASDLGNNCNIVLTQGFNYNTYYFIISPVDNNSSIFSNPHSSHIHVLSARHGKLEQDIKDYLTNDYHYIYSIHMRSQLYI